MKTMIGGLALLGLASAAAAQAPAGPVSRADFLAGSKAQFTRADANHDSILTRDELIADMTKQMGSAPPVGVIDSVFGMLDTDHDGKATAAEVEAMQAKMFDQWDTNHDNMLTPEEMMAAQDTTRAGK